MVTHATGGAPCSHEPPESIPQRRSAGACETGCGVTGARRRGARRWLLTACAGVTGGADDPSNRRLRMMIPNSPGGGYDLTGRAAVKVMEDDDLTGRFEITNVLGASGTVAMQRLLNEKGADDLVMTMGLGVVGAVYTNKSDAVGLEGHPDRPPDRGAGGDPGPRGLAASRPSTTWSRRGRRTPGALTVGGGSSPGGPDHLFPMQLAKEIGIDPRDVNYISYDGGGPLTTALLGSKIDVGMSGLGEFEGQIKDGSLRVLAVSGAEAARHRRRPDAQGVRRRHGLHQLARRTRPARHLRRAQRDYLTDLFTEMHDTKEWRRGARAQRLDRQLRHRRRVRDVPGGAGRARRHDPRGAGTRMSTTTTPPAQQPAHGTRPRRRHGAVRPRGLPRRRRRLRPLRRHRPRQGLRRPAGAALRLPVRRRRRPGRASASPRPSPPPGVTAPRPRRARTSTSPRRATRAPWRCSPASSSSTSP